MNCELGAVVNLPPAVLVLVAVTLLWLGIATVVALLAARRLRAVEAIAEDARSTARLLRQSPARPMLVRSDDSIAIDPALARGLGFETMPRDLDLLGAGSGGLEPEGFALLTAALADGRATASDLRVMVKAKGSQRVFEVCGEPAPGGPSGDFALWFYDLSAGEEEKSLAARLKQAEAALDSLTQLIEAAPFPMWYRGPDLRLGLVNQAFVQAVEGQTSAEVIERQLELIDASGEGRAGGGGAHGAEGSAINLADAAGDHARRAAHAAAGRRSARGRCGGGLRGRRPGP